jgi:hypothetical protein
VGLRPWESHDSAFSIGVCFGIQPSPFLKQGLTDRDFITIPESDPIGCSLVYYELCIAASVLRCFGFVHSLVRHSRMGAMIISLITAETMSLNC